MARNMRAAVVFCTLTTALGQCYLEDAAATCPVCWKTTSTGVTTSSECPENSVRLTFITGLPEILEADFSYQVEYEMDVNMTIFPVVHSVKNDELWMVPHSNVHSCVANRGACTPFVSNSPGLSTHTPEMRGNATVDGTQLLELFVTEVKLPEGQYTIILHGRFYVVDELQSADQDCYPDCLTKYDVAVGISREAVPAMAAPSLDAYISAGFMGGIVTAVTVTAGWAVRKGKLNFGLVLRAIAAPEVRLPCLMLSALGDMITFSLAVEGEVMVDPELAEIIPVCVIIIFCGWVETGYSMACAARALRRVFRKRFEPDRFVRRVAAKVSVQLGHFKNVGEATDSTLVHDLVTDEASKRTLLDFDATSSELDMLPVVLLSFLFVDAPLTIVSAYILVATGNADAKVVVTLCMSSVGGGANFATLGVAPLKQAAIRAQLLALEGQCGHVLLGEFDDQALALAHEEGASADEALSAPVECPTSLSVHDMHVDDSETAMDGSAAIWNNVPLEATMMPVVNATKSRAAGHFVLLSKHQVK